jgi:lysozyme family protein
VDVDDIRGLPKQLARQLFRDRFWRPLRCAEMMDPVGLKLFDMAVNVGITQGVKLLQDALNRSESRTKWNAYPKLLRDGIMGENTLDAVQHNHPDELTNLICEEQADFYRLLIRQNPKFEDFKDGWLNRAYSLYVGDLPEEVSIT